MEVVKKERNKVKMWQEDLKVISMLIHYNKEINENI